MVMPQYMSDVAKEMTWRSENIRRDFAQHRLSAGENRQDLVKQFLVDHLPERFGIDTGFIISSDNQFSNQADLIIVDKQNNAPLYSGYRNRLWPVESVYALIEVKTHLTPTDIGDAVEKGRRFKSMKREFCYTSTPQPTENSLYAIWAFESPTPAVLKDNLKQALHDIDLDLQPDLVVVPGCLVSAMGNYLGMAILGEPGSERRRIMEQEYPNLSVPSGAPVAVYDLGDISLLAWYIWLDSWLRQAGSRFCDPIRYVPPDAGAGTPV